MLPKSNTTNQNKSFIEQARRAQIIEATISVLAQNGYVNTSFAKIGKQAGISASLISYHFKNKEELTEEVYKSILQGRAAHVGAKIAAAQNASDKLRAAIESDLFYMGTQPELFQALVEILFVARSKVDPATHRNDDIHAGFIPIADILKAGQASGEFGDFDAFNMAIIIDSARDGFLGQLAGHSEFDLEQFTKTLLNTTFAIIKKKTK